MLVVGECGWVVITNDKSIRTRSVEAQMAIDTHLKVVHLIWQCRTRHGMAIGGSSCQALGSAGMPKTNDKLNFCHS
nr:hypothetical protein [Mycobacterium lepromatosis]